MKAIDKMSVYLNTSAFDLLIKHSGIKVTTKPSEARLLVLGAKQVDYSRFSNLKSVYRFGVGVENIDFEFLKKKSIPLYFPSEKAKQILYDSVADFTIYAILKLFYKDALGDIYTWRKKQRNYLGNKVALVIGTGNIGKRVADKLSCFLKVKTYDVQYNRQEQFKLLVRGADIITVHIPLIDENKNFFNRQRLSWVKDDAIIVNTARGEVFEEEALYEKLINSNCRAFFDVFWQEPYSGKLRELGKDKFFMTPHSASNTTAFIQEGLNDIIKIINRLKNG